MVIILYFQCLSFFVGRHWRKQLPLLLFTSALFVIAVLLFAGDTVLALDAFTTDRNVPGGPAAFIPTGFSIPAVVMGNIAYPLQSWLADSFLV
jgi:hypothetical protein